MKQIIEEDIFGDLKRITETVAEIEKTMHPLAMEVIYKSIEEGRRLRSEVLRLNNELKTCRILECPRMKDMQTNEYGTPLCPITGTEDGYE